MPGSQLGQFSVVSDGQIVPDLAQLFFDDIKIVEQPFGGGGYGLFALNCVCRGAVVFDEYAAILLHAWNQRLAGIQLRPDHLG